ncbi:MAG TPA: SpoIVB peptidase [Firmicutes bacterium]|nr:SpoIVB peptidase [Bacillota bacterium]
MHQGTISARTIKILILVSLAFLASGLALVAGAWVLNLIAGIPGEIRMSYGAPREITAGLPIEVYMPSHKKQVIRVVNLDSGLRPDATSREASLLKVGRGQKLRIDPVSIGTSHVEVRVARILPPRQVRISVVPEIRVVPGGHAIGVLLAAQGVIVVGHYPVVDANGRSHYPGSSSGIQVGDVILKVDDIPVEGTSHLETLIDRAGLEGRAAEITLSRDGAIIKVNVTPVRTKEIGLSGSPARDIKYRIGVLVRDNAAGVGTLSFYDLKTRIYGALGHVITDAATNREVDVKDGRIVAACIVGIHQGQRGQPGEKIGTFDGTRDVLGSITKNSKLGIFGTLSSMPPSNPFYPRGVPVALAEEVTEGEAEMLTVIDDDRIERFDVYIERVLRNRTPGAKGLIVRITDQRLISRTGGIVQGMSGSPIIQNGRLAAVVTHVFLADPTRGYATLAEWMVGEAGLVAERSFTPTWSRRRDAAA